MYTKLFLKRYLFLFLDYRLRTKDFTNIKIRTANAICLDIIVYKLCLFFFRLYAGKTNEAFLFYHLFK